MTRKLIAMLLCIAMLGSMTVYAVGDVTEPTDDLSLTTDAASFVEDDQETDTASSVEDDQETDAETSDGDEEELSLGTSADTGVAISNGDAETLTASTTSVSDTAAASVVGDTIYIKSGSLTYKVADETSASREVVFNYETKIVSIVTDENGNASWYEFQPTGLLDLPFIRDYKFVKVENTTTENPDATEPDDTTPSEPELEPSTEQIVDGLAFSTEIPVVVTEAPVEDVEKINDVLPVAGDHCYQVGFAYDISAEDQEGVEITVKGMLDTELLDEYGRCFVDIYHLMDDGEIEILRGSINEDGDITFETDSFSTFYFLAQYYSNNATYTLKSATAVKVSTILTECGVPDGFTIKSVTPSPATVTGDNGEEVSWITISGSGNNTKITITELFSGLHSLTVVTNNGTYVIDVAVPEIFYYLDGTDWCMDTTTSRFILGTVDYGTRTANTKVLNVDDVTGGVVIYARPGMVLQFTNGWRWGPNEDNLYTAHQDYGGWCWCSAKNTADGAPYTDSGNFLIIEKNIEEVKTFTIDFSQSNYSAGRLQHGTTATIHVIPEYKPTLLENQGVSLKTIPVTLINYDGNAWKDYYRSQEDYNDQGLFEFKSASSGVPVTVETLTNGINYGGWTMGILEDELNEAGLPVVSDGYAVDLFSEKSITYNRKEAKKVYEDVDFQFVYDPNTGYYTYASQLNAAQFFEEDNTIKLYRENLSAADAGAAYQSNNAGFYPFIDVSKAFLNTAGSTGTGALAYGATVDPAGRDTYPSDKLVSENETWFDALDDGYAQYSGYLAKDLVSTYDESGLGTVDMHFGLHVESKFYLPAGKQINGQDIEFSFTGDDDLWVFIDGELVLDLGGGHGPMSGTINFTDGTVTAENRFGNTTYYTLNDNKTVEKVSGVYKAEGYGWADDTTHTLSIFYLEKCSGHSNCYMRFNIPILPDGAATVTKNVLNDEGTDAFAIDTNEDYTFIMYTAADDDDVVNVDAGNFAPLKDYAYTIVGGDNTILKTDSDTGEFTLKAGQTAQFANIDRFTEVYVVEKDPTGTYKYSKVSVDGQETVYTTERDPYAKTVTKIIPDESTIGFSFTNYMEVSDLTVSKKLLDSYDVVSDSAQYKVEVKIADALYSGAAKLNGEEITIANGEVVLEADDTLVIDNIPTNVKYSVLESDPNTTPGAPLIGENTKSGYKYLAPTYSVNSATAGTEAPNTTLADDTSVVITNELKKLFGNLKITKTGIDALDNHAAEGKNKQEQQSTVYTVSGTSYSGDTVNLEVVVVGNSSVTIDHLPVGEYSVQEKTDWAWRYKLSDTANARKLEVSEDATAETTYNNERKNIYWLSGDNYCKNLWPIVASAAVTE